MSGLLVWLLVGASFAKEPPLVKIPDQGTLLGREVSRARVQRILGFFGIPYAQPPVDQLRFAAPVTEPLPSWEDVRNATEYPPACLQTEKDYREESLPFLHIIAPPENKLVIQEDCLYLNVFTPTGGSPPSGYAVVIWLHPGNFTTGSTSWWNPHTLVYRHRIIVVTVAYRLSIMGFFSTNDGEAPGNYGLMDQQAAMMWVKRNIRLFGGNPDNISLMGYGTGGISVGMHIINTISREYFHKAIIMSANFLSPSAVKYPDEDKNLLDRLAEGFGCIRKPTSQLIDCLRHADGEVLIEQTSNVNWRPVLDGGLSNSTAPFLTDLPRNFFERGDFHKIPILTGFTDMEDILGIKSLETEFNNGTITIESLQQMLSDIVSSDIPFNNNTESCIFNYDHIVDAVMFFYGPTIPAFKPDLLRQILANFTTDRNYAASTYLQAKFFARESPVYVYRFDTKPITNWAVDSLPDWVSVPHLFDLIFVWGIPYWEEFDGKSFQLRDKRFSDIIMSCWTNFVKSSNPNEGSFYPVQWNLFQPDATEILIIDSTFNMSNSHNLNKKAFQFWNEYYPKVLEIATQCCNATDDGTLPLPVSTLFLSILQFIINYQYWI